MPDMKILIVDDEPKRYPKLITRFEELGVRRDDIHMVQCTADAHPKMVEIEYDLIILDILIPFRAENDEDVSFSLDLLMEIQNGEELKKPRYVLGITSDPEISKDVKEQFTEYTWTVLEYSASNDDWINRAVNCAKFVKQGVSKSAITSAVDVVIICALARPELEQVLKLPWNWSAPRPIDETIFVRDGSFQSGDREFSVCAASAPRMGMVSTALLASSMIHILRPSLIIMTGICAGVRGKVNMGDVLFTDPAWDFQSGKRVRDGTNTAFSIRPHHIAATNKIRRHIELIRDDTAGLLRLAQEYDGDAPGVTKVVPGPVASGSAVLADGEVIKEIKLQHQELIGVEMEAYGLYSAAFGSSPTPGFFAVKGVCDFADPDKGDNNQRYAAYASANVMRMLLERFGDRIIG